MVLTSRFFALAAVWAFWAPLASAIEVPRGLSERLSGARVVGVYRVSDILMNHPRLYRGSVCSGGYRDRLQDWNEPHRDCGATFVLVQSRESVAMFLLKGEPHESAYLTTFLMGGAVIDPQCKGSVSLSGNDLQEIDSGDLCRARHAAARDTRDAASYVYLDDNKDPRTGSTEDAIQNFAAVGLPVGVDFRFEIRIPKGVDAPEKLELVKEVSGSVLLVSGSWTERYALTRVGDEAPF